MEVVVEVVVAVVVAAVVVAVVVARHLLEHRQRVGILIGKRHVDIHDGEVAAVVEDLRIVVLHARQVHQPERGVLLPLLPHLREGGARARGGASENCARIAQNSARIAQNCACARRTIFSHSETSPVSWYTVTIRPPCRGRRVSRQGIAPNCAQWHRIAQKCAEQPHTLTTKRSEHARAFVP